MSLADEVATSFTSTAAIRGESISYTDGSGTANLTAVRGETALEVVSEAGTATPFTSIDWLVLASDLDLGQGPITPLSRHRITQGSDVYEVGMIGGAQAYRFLDPSQTVMRIHTQRVSST